MQLFCWRYRVWVVLVVAALAGQPGWAADLAGKWTAEFDGPLERRPKMVREIILDLKPEPGGKLTGTMEAGSWPGKAALIDGKIEGNRFSFVAVGKLPWQRRSPEGTASGLPRLVFSGEIRGNGAMTLRLVWDSVMLYGSWDGPTEYDLTGKRQTGTGKQEQAADPSPPDL